MFSLWNFFLFHHFKHCSNARRLRSAICSQCGLTTHDARQCTTLPDIARARMEDASIRCMSCNQLGHALCKQIVKDSVVKDTQVSE